MHKVATRSNLFTPDLENDQTHVILRANPDRSGNPLSGHTTLHGLRASPNK
jgi:hypothetical protein